MRRLFKPLAVVSLVLWLITGFLWCTAAESPDKARLSTFSRTTVNLGLTENADRDKNRDNFGGYRWLVISRYRPLSTPLQDPSDADLFRTEQSDFLGLMWVSRCVDTFELNDLYVGPSGHRTVFGRETRIAVPLGYVYVCSLAPAALIIEWVGKRWSSTVDVNRRALTRWRSWAVEHPATNAALLVFVVAHLVAVGLFANSGWTFWFFLGPAIRPFFFWTIPFAAVVAGSTRLLPQCRRPVPFVVAVLLAIGIAVACTFLLGVTLSMLFGMFFQGFSFFTPLYPWAAGALAGLVGTVALRPPQPAPIGFCSVCGYDLRATPGRCPECGAVPAAG